MHCHYPPHTLSYLNETYNFTFMSLQFLSNNKSDEKKEEQKYLECAIYTLSEKKSIQY